MMLGIRITSKRHMIMQLNKVMLLNTNKSIQQSTNLRMSITPNKCIKTIISNTMKSIKNLQCILSRNTMMTIKPTNRR